MQTFTPQFLDAARPGRRSSGDRWFVDETYVKVAGRWTYLYRAVDQHGQSSTCWSRRAATPPRHAGSSNRALRFGASPVEVTTDRAPLYPRIVEDLEPAARHVTEQDPNNRIEADHGRLTARPRPIRGLKQVSSAKTIAAGHAFVHNLRRGHYELTADVPVHDRVRVAFVELALGLRSRGTGLHSPATHGCRQRNSAHRGSRVRLVRSCG